MPNPPFRTLWIDYLRSFITALVVAHHASLAYTTFASFNKVAYILSSNPIVDTHRWIGLDIFENFNDVFFMSLMFFISGLFVLTSLNKKGVGAFIRDRFYRLFIPFAIDVTLLMLIAYYPAYYVAHGQHDLKAYVVDYFTTEGWPVGPPWFIWQLFFFNVVIALLFPFLKNGLYKLSNKLASLKNKAGILFLTWLLITWILYVPLTLLFGPYSWTGFGPFDFQKSRVLLYGGYFVFGALVGNAGLDNGIFAGNTSLVKKWPLWMVLCLLTYVMLTIIPPHLRSMVAAHTLPELPAWLIYFTVYVASCTLSCITFLTTFKACIHRSRSWWNSLSANAYGIYLVHYILIVWCQYFLLSSQLPAFIKFVITFGVALSGSWLLVSLLRKQSLIKKYL